MKESEVLRPVRAAVTVLTRIPVGGFPYSDAEWAWAPAYFPLVGLALGVLLGLLLLLLLPVGNLGAAALVVGVSLLATGAYHEDGLADTSDALGGAFDRDKVVAILKDSRIGSFGAAAVSISLIARVALIAQIGRDGVWALPLVGCAARVGPVWLLARMPYVSAGSTARAAHLASAGSPQALVATSWLIAAGAVAFGLGDVSALRLGTLAIVLAGVTVLCAWRYHRRLGGVTGDLLGAAEQLCEIAGFAVLAWVT